MNFSINDGIFEISIDSYFGALMFVLFIYEVYLIFITKTSTIHKIFLYFKIWKYLKKNKPEWWSIKRISLITINKENKSYKIFVSLSNSINKSYTCDWISVDFLGRVKRTNIFKDIKFYDKDCQEEIKSYIRDKKIKDIIS